MSRWARWTACLCCRSREEEDEEDSDDDSEIYWLRRRHAERQQRRDNGRAEYLENVLITKKVVSTKTSDDEDQFVIDNDTDPNCAVCLIDYEEGDKVSFSHNPRCQHHFHRLCIIEWLKDHNECPCCRSNYLAFGDGEEDEQANDDEGGVSSTSQQPIERNHPLDRLYQTGVFETQERSENSSHQRQSSQRGDEEPWEVRFERTVERLRRQVEDRVQVARRQIQDHGENRRNNRSSNENDGDEETGAAAENNDPVERSIEMVRAQLSRLRQAGDQEIRNLRRNNDDGTNNTSTSTRNNRDVRWEDAIQVVRTRLHDIASSESAERLRDRSRRTLQNIRLQVSQRRQHSAT